MRVPMLASLLFLSVGFVAQPGAIPKKPVPEFAPSFKVDVSGGFSYLTGRIDTDVPTALQKYLEQLKSGYHIGFGLTYYPVQNFGFGLKYTLFKSKNSLDNYTVYDTAGTKMKIHISDNISTHFIAPTISTRVSSDDRQTTFFSDLSVGYLYYHNKAEYIRHFTITGATLGVQIGLGAGISAGEHAQIMFGVSYLMGLLGTLHYDDGRQVKTVKLDKEKKETLARVDASIGLRWQF